MRGRGWNITSLPMVDCGGQPASQHPEGQAAGATQPDWPGPATEAPASSLKPPLCPQGPWATLLRSTPETPWETDGKRQEDRKRGQLERWRSRERETERRARGRDGGQTEIGEKPPASLLPQAPLSALQKGPGVPVPAAVEPRVRGTWLKASLARQSQAPPGKWGEEPASQGVVGTGRYCRPMAAGTCLLGAVLTIWGTRRDVSETPAPVILGVCGPRIGRCRAAPQLPQPGRGTPDPGSSGSLGFREAWHLLRPPEAVPIHGSVGSAGCWLQRTQEGPFALNCPDLRLQRGPRGESGPGPRPAVSLRSFARKRAGEGVRVRLGGSERGFGFLNRGCRGELPWGFSSEFGQRPPWAGKAEGRTEGIRASPRGHGPTSEIEAKGADTQLRGAESPHWPGCHSPRESPEFRTPGEKCDPAIISSKAGPLRSGAGAVLSVEEFFIRCK